MSSSARADWQEGALVVVARRRDLLQLQGRADLPARFFGVFEGGLEETAAVDSPEDLDEHLKRYRAVGLDAEVMLAGDPDSARDQRYLDNLGQKLAARPVVILTVLGDRDECGHRSLFSVQRAGFSGGAELGCDPKQDGLAALRARLESAGFRLELVHEGGGDADAARLRLAAEDGGEILGLRDKEGRFAELLAFEACPDAAGSLQSRAFSGELARQDDPRVLDILVDCMRRREHESLQRLHAAWLGMLSRMQPDTRARTQLELVVVAERALETADEQRIRLFDDVARIWVMTDKLRAGGNHQTRVRARFVWPDAVGCLLARILVPDGGIRERGTFAWRGFVCGIGADAAAIERKRAAYTERILDGEGQDERAPQIERKGPFEPILEPARVSRAFPEMVRWQDGKAERTLDRGLDEKIWVDEYRAAGRDLGERRMKLDRRADDAPETDPESVYSREYWRLVHQSTMQLRVFGTARLFRDRDLDLREKLQAHLDEWQQDVLTARRQIAVDREEALQLAEELDVARRFHLGVGWRMAIGSAVAIYAGFLSLNVLRVFLSFSAGTWAAGLWMFFVALAGGWAGAILPMWAERRRGEEAARLVDRALEEVDRKHRDAVEQTHEVFRDAESVRQSIRISAIHRRTTLLAERAWHVVRNARDDLSREFERRKLLPTSSGSVDESERLAREDSGEWRAGTVIRPDLATKDLEPETEEMDESMRKVGEDFRVTWSTRLDREDPNRTGFLRVAVLQRLVRDLADDINASLERIFLQHVDKLWEKSKQPLSLDAWVDPILRSVGRDAASHALLSVLDEETPVRTEGQYVVLCRDGMPLADEVCKSLRGRRQGFADVEPRRVGELPHGGFAMVFHAVGLRWSDRGLVLDGSEREAPVDRSAAPESDADGSQA